MANSPLWLQRFATTWNLLNLHNQSLLDALYHPEIVFQDPSTILYGRDAVKAHILSLYHNIHDVQYELAPPLLHGDEAATQPWTLQYRHPKLAQGRLILVEGVSILQCQDGLIIHHRDYFDLGQLLYEHVPLLGRGVRLLKQRIQ